MKYFKVIIFFLFLLLATSCGVYNPHLIDIPLIHEKNDLRIDAGISILVPSVRTSFSYGITDKMAAEAFISYGSDYRYYFQASTGTYKKIKEKFVQEIYAGFGYGYGNSYNNANPGTLDGNYKLYFAQYNFGRIANQRSGIECGFSFKSGFLHSKLSDNNYHELNTSTIEFKSNSLLLEPTVMARFGKGKLKFSTYLGASYLLKLDPIKRYTTTDLLNFGFGLNYRL